jgi:hypothetical protein
MSQDRVSTAAPDTRPIYRLIRRTRLLLRSTWVLTGLGLLLGLGLGTLAVVTLADAFVPVAPEVGLTPEHSVIPHVAFPGWVLRLAALLLVVVPAAWLLIVGVLRPLLRRLAPVQVARRIESHIPGIHNRLVSCLDLDGNEKKREQSPAFYRRLLQEALDRIRGFRARTAVDFRSLGRAGLFAAVTLIGFGLAWLLFADRLSAAMARIVNPFADIPPHSGVLYAVEPADAKVLRGEDIPFAVHVRQGEPNKLWLELRSPVSGEHLRYDLDRQKQDPALWTFTLGSTNIAPGFENAFTYRVFGGGTWSPEYHVTMVDRPRIVSQHTVLHYPDYMLIEPRVGAPDTLDVTGPEDSRVEVVVQAEGQVSEGAVQLLEYRQPGPGVKDRPERVWVDDKLPAGATADGTWTWDSDRFQRPAHTEPPAFGLHGHWFQGAAEPFQVGADDNLFVEVYQVPDHRPDAIVLEWNDGTSWEHRACWGADVDLGNKDSPSRRHVGPLPEAGKWVRLEVPTAALDLQGKTLRGLSFKTLGGQCYWSKAGVLPPVLSVKESYPMQPSGDAGWSGRFPLRGTGLYRVELRNEMGYPNKTMKEARFTAVSDRPPQIILERPAIDLVLSEPTRVPLTMTAADDYGLLDLSLEMQREGDWHWSQRTIKGYDHPVRSETVVWPLDLEALGVKVGETLRYRVQARDRKRQTATSQEYTVRIAADPNAADQQLANFEKTQDPFRENLAKLLAEQAKVRDAVEKLNAKYAPLMEKVKEAQAEARTKAEGTAKDKDTAPAAQDLKLDPESARLLQELQKELGQLAQKEQQNVQLGQQVSAELAKAAEQMANLKMMPQPLVQQMQAVQQMFQQRTVPALQNLQGQMSNSATPKQPPADLKGLQQASDRLQKDLEAVQSRLNALAAARAGMRKDLNEALEQLRREMAREDSGLTARKLEELRDFIARMREQMKGLEGKQEQLEQQSEQANDKDLPNVEKKQADLDKQLENLLAQARNLLKDDKARRMKRRPQFPGEPYTPDQGEEMVRPKEEDTDEPAAEKKDGGDKGDPAKADKKDDPKEGEEEPTYAPALGGPKPKIDPRYAKKMRSVSKKPKGDKGEPDDPDSRRDDLEAHQERNLRNLDQAEKSLASDQQSLENMLRQLTQPGRPNGNPQGQDEAMDSEMARQLAEMMRSPAMREAMAMLARMRQGPPRGNPQSAQRSPNPSQTPMGNMQGAPNPNAALEGELAKLDPAARSVLMKMPPRVREELLQGMREEGPEGYRKFIEDYFKRLTEVKGPK